MLLVVRTNDSLPNRAGSIRIAADDAAQAVGSALSDHATPLARRAAGAREGDMILTVERWKR